MSSDSILQIKWLVCFIIPIHTCTFSNKLVISMNGRNNGYATTSSFKSHSQQQRWISSPNTKQQNPANPTNTSLFKTRNNPASSSTQGLQSAPNRELMQQIVSERANPAKKVSHYHALKDLQEKEIRDLSKVIESSIVASMTKGRYQMLKKREEKEQADGQSSRFDGGQNNKKEGNINQIRYGVSQIHLSNRLSIYSILIQYKFVSEIDTNYELKKFIVQQSEKRLNVKNKLLYDVKNFMEDLVKTKDTSTSKVHLAEKPRRRVTLGNKFLRKQITNGGPIDPIMDDGQQKNPKDIEYIRLKSATLTHRNKLRSRMRGTDGTVFTQENQRASGLLDRAITGDDMQNRRMMATANSYQSFQGVLPQRFLQKGLNTSSSSGLQEIGGPLKINVLSSDIDLLEDQPYLQKLPPQTALKENRDAGLLSAEKLNIQSDSSLLGSTANLLINNQTSLTRPPNNIINVTTGSMLENEVYSATNLDHSSRRPYHHQISTADRIQSMISQLNKLQKKRDPLKKVLIRRADQHQAKFDKMSGRVERNMQRNEGVRAFLAEDTDMINILATYRI